MTRNIGALDRAHAAKPTAPTPYMFHPSISVSDRAPLHEFFKRVFGMEGYNQVKTMTDPRLDFNKDYPVDYSYYIWLGDMWFDAVQPNLLSGRRASPKRTLDRLHEVAYIIEDIPAVLRAAEKAGFRVFNMFGEQLHSDNPDGAISSAMPDISLLWIDTEDAGIGVELAYMTPRIYQTFGDVCFQPMSNEWKPERPTGDNWLGIEYCSHHTILTDNVKRALTWSCDILGGWQFNEGVNHVLETDSTYVWLGQTALEFARPRGEGSASWAALQDKTTDGAAVVQEDVYHEIAFKVADLNAARVHLKKCGVNLVHDDAHGVTTDPKDSIGVRWTFIDHVLPRDPRA